MPYLKWQRAVLWIEEWVCNKDLKLAYRKISRKYHPDLNPWCKTSEKMMKKVTYAYDVLTDVEKQKEHIEMMREKIRQEKKDIEKKNKVKKTRAKKKRK